MLLKMCKHFNSLYALLMNFNVSCTHCEKRLSPALLRGRYLEKVFDVVYINVHSVVYYLSRVMRKSTFWFPTLSDANQAVHLQKMARGLKFRI